MSWKQLATKEVYKNKWMWVTEDQVETDSGVRLTFGIVHKRPFALIIPWDGTQLTLVGQYRYPVDKFSWEFPAGHAEDEDILEAARKELEEETGLRAKEIKEIGHFFVVPGHHTQTCHVFLATTLSMGILHRDPSEEDMQVRKLSLEEFRAMLVAGEIIDGPTIAAFALLETKKLFN